MSVDKKTTALRILPSIIGILGILSIIFWGWRMYVANQSMNWKETAGVVTHSYVAPYGGNTRGYYQAVVFYDYSVNGVKYQGRRIYINDTYSNKPSELQSLAALYPISSTVPVFYDPAAPSRAVLKPGIQGTMRDYGLFFVGVLMVTAALMVRVVIRKSVLDKGQY